MIDTIVLLLSKDSFSISNPDAFTPSARWVEHVSVIHGIQSKQNPLKRELVRGIYKPHLTLSHRFSLSGHHELALKIELSLPKLLFGNNFDELQLKDFVPITQKLATLLEQMGIITTPQALAAAPVLAIHYSKNIPLNDGSTPYHYITKIREANVKLSLDINQTDYRNEGHSFKWHCNSYEVVFYDKIRDLEKAKQSSKRALEKDSAVQMHIFDRFTARKNLEFLRMEVRLNKRNKIKQLCKKLSINTNMTFKSLFKPAIAKKILLHYVDELASKRPVLRDFNASNDKALLATLIVNNPDLGPKQLLHVFGLKKALECYTLRELKNMFSKQTTRSWSRLLTEVTKVTLPAHYGSFAILREHIVKFKPVKLAKLIKTT